MTILDVLPTDVDWSKLLEDLEKAHVVISNHKPWSEHYFLFGEMKVVISKIIESKPHTWPKEVDV